MIIESTTLIIFLGAALTVNLSPGASMLYVTAKTTASGQRAGIISALGMGVGGFLHTIAAALGLSALLIQSATAFNLVKYAGSLYLIYLGANLIFSKTKPPKKTTPTKELNNFSIFYQGILVDVLNPKVALFFLAFLPQFVDPNTSSVFLQTLILGSLFCISGMIVNSLLAFTVNLTTSSLSASQVRQKFFRLISGSVLIGLGVRLASQD